MTHRRPIPVSVTNAIAALLEPYCETSPAELRALFTAATVRADDAFLPLMEVSEITHLSPRTLRHWAATGRVPARRRGKLWHLDLSAVWHLKVLPVRSRGPLPSCIPCHGNAFPASPRVPGVPSPTPTPAPGTPPFCVYGEAK